MHATVQHSSGQENTRLPIGLSFDEAEQIPRAGLITLTAIYLLLASGHAFRSWQNSTLLYLIYVIALGMNAIGFCIVFGINGRALSVRTISTLFFMMVPSILLVRWSQSMRQVLRFAYPVHLAGHVILSALLLGAVLLVGYEVPQAIDGRGLETIYVAGAWLVRGSVFGLLGLALLLILSMNFNQWRQTLWRVLLRRNYNGTTASADNLLQKSYDLKRQQLYRLAGNITLVWLVALLDSLEIPFVDFAIFALIGLASLFPKNALCQFQRAPPSIRSTTTTTNYMASINRQPISQMATRPTINSPLRMV